MRDTAIGVVGFEVYGLYAHDEAQLRIRCIGKPEQLLDEDECDKLLRVWEYAGDPVEDLAEFFRDLGYGGKAAKVAQWFCDHGQQLSECVYETT